MNEPDGDIEILRRKEKEQIREFIEQLVNSLIDGNVDEASVSKIFNDKQCEYNFRFSLCDYIDPLFIS